MRVSSQLGSIGVAAFKGVTDVAVVFLGFVLLLGSCGGGGGGGSSASGGVSYGSGLLVAQHPVTPRLF